MPLSLVYLASFLRAASVFLLMRLLSWVEARSKHPFGKSFVRKLPLGAYLAYMAQFDFTYIHNSVFDQIIAPITRYFRQAEVEAWFKKAGQEEVQISSRNEMSWQGFGRKVSPPS